MTQDNHNAAGASSPGKTPRHQTTDAHNLARLVHRCGDNQTLAGKRLGIAGSTVCGYLKTNRVPVPIDKAACFELNAATAKEAWEDAAPTLMLTQPGLDNAMGRLREVRAAEAKAAPDAPEAQDDEALCFVTLKIERKAYLSLAPLLQRLGVKALRIDAELFDAFAE